MEFDVDHFVRRAGLALEVEDRLLLGNSRIHGENGGLIRLYNERYYQFIIWRAVNSIWRAECEHEYRDLVVFAGSEKPHAIFEMKRWYSNDGRRELHGIRGDLDKLTKSDAPVCGMIIFSINPRGHFLKNTKVLEEEIPQLRSVDCKHHIFNTFNKEGDPVEFWLGLWLVERSISLPA